MESTDGAGDWRVQPKVADPLIKDLAGRDPKRYRRLRGWLREHFRDEANAAEFWTRVFEVFHEEPKAVPALAKLILDVHDGPVPKHGEEQRPQVIKVVELVVDGTIVTPPSLDTPEGPDADPEEIAPDAG